MTFAEWQRMSHDREDMTPEERCSAFDQTPETEQSSPGVCLRRKGHPRDWHEGRSRRGNLVSWPAS